MSDRKRAERLLADNRKAHHDYHILHTYEAGIVLLGTEVKSIREGRVNLRDSFARVEGAEVFIYNIHCQPVQSPRLCRSQADASSQVAAPQG